MERQRWRTVHSVCVWKKDRDGADGTEMKQDTKRPQKECIRLRFEAKR